MILPMWLRAALWAVVAFVAVWLGVHGQWFDLSSFGVCLALGWMAGRR